MRGAQDVNLIDLRRIDPRDAVLDFRPRGQFAEKGFARGGRQLFGIVDLPQPFGHTPPHPIRRKNHRRGEHRSRQRTAPRLIHPGDARHTPIEQFKLESKAPGNHSGHDA